MPTHTGRRLPKHPENTALCSFGHQFRLSGTSADYAHGIIGDLPNFPGFRGGVALGPYLEHVFGIPVFINNDGNLFAYGEA